MEKKPTRKRKSDTEISVKPKKNKMDFLSDINGELTPQQQDNKNLHKIDKFGVQRFDIYNKSYEDLANKLNEYVEYTVAKEQVPNMSGFSDYIKVSRTTLYQIENGEIQKASDELIQFCKDLKIYMENILATRMLSGDVNRSTLTGYIFSLKALNGWNETQSLAIQNSIDIKISFDN
jgi:DNA-binding XRE family transcriptional regulator